MGWVWWVVWGAGESPGGGTGIEVTRGVRGLLVSVGDGHTACGEPVA